MTNRETLVSHLLKMNASMTSLFYLHMGKAVEFS